MAVGDTRPMTNSSRPPVREADHTDAAELVRLRHCMFRSMTAAGVSSSTGEVEDASWYEAAAAAIRAQMASRVLAAFVVDQPPRTVAAPLSGPALIGCGIVTLHQHLPGPGFATGLGGSMSSVYVEVPHRGRGGSPRGGLGRSGLAR